MSKTTFTLKRKLFAGPGFIGSMFGAKNFQNIGRMAAVNKARPGTFGAGKFVGNALAGTAKAAGSTALVAGGLAVGTGALAKKGIEKAGEQSDGSKLFSQTKKDNKMATTYRLKRKTFSEGEEKKSNLGKIALGTAATAGLAFAGARRGMLGTNAMKSTNAMWAKAGNAIGNRSMVQSGAKKYGAAVVKESGAKLEGKALDQAINKERKAFLKQNNMFQAGKTPTTPAQQKATGEGVSIMRSAVNKI